MTVGLLLCLVGPLQLLTLDGFELIDFPNHALSRGCLVFNKATHVILLLLLFVYHAIVPVLKSDVALVQACKVTDLLSEFESLQLELGDL